MRLRLPRIRIPTFSQATNTVTPRKAEGQLVEANRVANQQAAVAAAQQAEYNRKIAEQAAAQKAAQEAQVAEYNRRMAEQMEKIREQQEATASAERTQAMTPPDAQAIGAQNQTAGRRRRSNRGSLLAGDTGGYNPATGSAGRLGARSLLG
jgi:hypothetical protein